MRRFPPVAALGAAAVVLAVLAGVTCSFPTDESNQVFVTITLSAPLVVQGGEITAHGHAFRNTASGPVAVTDVDFQWSVSNDSIARVVNAGRGVATITGVNAGLVHLVAKAAVYANSTSKDSVIRVARALEIDSIRPDSVRYGGRITVYGVGINSIFLPELGGVQIVPDTFSFKGDPNGLGHMQFWVPPPATSDLFFGFGPGVFASAAETTFVADSDIFEPNDTAPARIDIDSTNPIPQLPAIRFYNPALDYEALDRGLTIGFDWYRFAQADTTQPFTLIFDAAGKGSDTVTFTILTDTIGYTTGNYFYGDSAWAVGPSAGLFTCRAYGYFMPMAPSDSFIVVLRNLTRPSVQLFSEYTQSGRYGLEIIRGAVSTDPRIGPDHFTPNEICNQADANFNADSAATTVSAATPAWVDTTLTIDFPHATDWYRFHITSTGPATEPVQVAITPKEIPGQTPSDLDITVVEATTLNYVDQAADTGSNETISFTANTNDDYYVIVSDYAGVPVRYGLCVVVNGACAAPFPAAPAGVSGVAPAPGLAVRRRPHGRRPGFIPAPVPGTPGTRRLPSLRR